MSAALADAGVAVTADEATADITVLVIAETLKPEDRLTVSRSDTPTVVILNKADLTGFGIGGPLAAAQRHAEALSSPGQRPPCRWPACSPSPSWTTN